MITADTQYIGDGVYVGHDHYQLWLAANHHENMTVALNRETFESLVDYAAKLWTTPPMGKQGSWTGLLDKAGIRILIGSEMEFDEKEWGSPDNKFVVGYDRGELLIKGTISDLSEFCKVLPSA